jgi:hypothetical protein
MLYPCLQKILSFWWYRKEAVVEELNCVWHLGSAGLLYWNHSSGHKQRIKLSHTPIQ